MNVPCSSPMVQHHQQAAHQLCPLALKPMIPCQQQQQQQHEHQNFPPNQPPQFMSPQQHHQPSFMSQSNGPPLEGGILGHYRPWPPTQLPPMHTREQGGFPPAMSPLLPAVFSPGGGPPGRGEHLLPHPVMSMDHLCMLCCVHIHMHAQYYNNRYVTYWFYFILAQGLHPLQQAFLLQNRQQQQQPSQVVF